MPLVESSVGLESLSLQDQDLPTVRGFPPLAIPAVAQQYALARLLIEQMQRTDHRAKAQSFIRVADIACCIRVTNREHHLIITPIPWTRHQLARRDGRAGERAERAAASAATSELTRAR